MTIEEKALKEYPVFDGEDCNGNPHDTNQYERTAFESGAEWMLDKACEWLLLHTTIPYETENGEPLVYSVIDTSLKRKEIVDEFRKAMEEE